MKLILERVHGTAGRAADRVALRQALAGVQVQQPGSPASVLLVRQVADPLPGKLLSTAGRLNRSWQRALQQRIGEIHAAAHRPKDYRPDPNAQAVLFADEAELLLCLLRADSRPQGSRPWWWTSARALLGCPVDSPAALLHARPRLAPTVVAALDEGVALSILAEMPAASLRVLLELIFQAFDYPAPARARALLATGLARAPETPKAWPFRSPAASGVGTNRGRRSPGDEPQRAAATSSDAKPAPVTGAPEQPAVEPPTRHRDERQPAPARPVQSHAETVRRVYRLLQLMARSPNRVRGAGLSRLREELAPSPAWAPAPEATVVAAGQRTGPGKRSNPGVQPAAVEDHPGMLRQHAPKTANEQRRNPEPGGPGPNPVATVATGFAGVFYLLNILPPFESDAPWKDLAAVASGLLGDPGAEDPLWPFLTALSGSATGQDADWIADMVDGTGALLSEAFEADTRSAALHLLGIRGELQASAARFDLLMPLEAIDIEIRRHGWDQDPGWRPDLGCFIYFHYTETFAFHREAREAASPGGEREP